MELRENLDEIDEFQQARQTICNAAWQTVENPEMPAWHRVGVALVLAKDGRDERAIDLLTGIFTGDSALVQEYGLTNYDKVTLVSALTQLDDAHALQRALAIANSIGDNEIFDAKLRAEAFITIAEHAQDDVQTHALKETLQALEVKPTKNSNRSLTDSQRAGIYLRAGTLAKDPSLYEQAFGVYKYVTPDRHIAPDRHDSFGTLAWELRSQIERLAQTNQPELRAALVSLTLQEYGQHKRPWDAILSPLIPVLAPEERKELLHNFTRRSKFMLDVAGYQLVVDTAKREEWLSPRRQRREERALDKLRTDRQRYHHLDESNTNWNLFQYGYTDDATLARALRHIELRRASEMSPKDREDVRAKLATGLSQDLFSPVQRTVAVQYLHELHEASDVDPKERFTSDLAMIRATGDTNALAEATEIMLQIEPWKQAELYIEARPELGSHLDYRLHHYFDSLQAGEKNREMSLA